MANLKTLIDRLEDFLNNSSQQDIVISRDDVEIIFPHLERAIFKYELVDFDSECDY